MYVRETSVKDAWQPNHPTPDLPTYLPTWSDAFAHYHTEWSLWYDLVPADEQPRPHPLNSSQSSYQQTDLPPEETRREGSDLDDGHSAVCAGK